MIILQKSLKNTANLKVINADMFLTYFSIMDHGRYKGRKYDIDDHTTSKIIEEFW
jgi:hypothetical protein